jgi:hypothetical protein
MREDRIDPSLTFSKTKLGSHFCTIRVDAAERFPYTLHLVHPARSVFPFPFIRTEKRHGVEVRTLGRFLAYFDHHITMQFVNMRA